MGVYKYGMGCSRKNPHTPTDGILEILTGWWVKGSGIQVGRGLNLKKSAGVILTNKCSCDSNV